MKKLIIHRIHPLAVVLALCACRQVVFAQHSDVLISVAGDRIVVQDPFYADSIRTFDVLGDGTVWHGTNPGYSTTAPAQFRLHDEVSFNIMSPLLFSSGPSWDVANEDDYLRQFWPVFPELTVTMSATTGNQHGFLIESIGNRGTLHQHHTFELASYSGHEPSVGAYAVQQVISADGYVTSDPFWIVLNSGLPIADFAASLRALPAIGAPGDYDRNGILDVRDIHRLREQIVASAELTELTTEFDLTGDVRIGPDDLEYWIRDIRQTWIGDANLDGEFNSTDVVFVFQSGHYEDGVLRNSQWQHGDWNSDGDFDSGDVIAAFQDGGYERGPRASVVPEPNISIAMFVFSIAAFWRRREGSASGLCMLRLRTRREEGK